MKIELNPRTLPEARLELERIDAEASKLEAEVKGLKDAKVEDSQPFKDIKAQLDAATGKVEVAEKAVKDAEAKASTLESSVGEKDKEIGDIKEKLTKAEAAVKDFDLRVETASKQKAIDFLAAKGLSPASIGLSTGDLPKAGLKGRDRTAEAFNKLDLK